jgi:hypothetical protein
VKRSASNLIWDTVTNSWFVMQEVKKKKDKGKEETTRDI